MAKKNKVKKTLVEQILTKAYQKGLIALLFSKP